MTWRNRPAAQRVALLGVVLCALHTHGACAEPLVTEHGRAVRATAELEDPGPNAGAAVEGVAQEAVGEWVSVAHLPISVARGSAVAVETPGGAWVVFSGGLTATGSTTDGVYAYDVAHDGWRPVGRLTTTRCNHASVALSDGRVLVIGGQSVQGLRFTGGLRSTEWIHAGSGQVRPGPRLPSGMRRPTVHVMPSGAVVAIGEGVAAVLEDPMAAGARWRMITLRKPRFEHASAVLDDGRIAVVGGQGRRSIEVVDLAAGRSQLRAVRLPEALDDHAVLRLPDGRLWVLGGQKTFAGRTTDETWLIDLPARTVEPGPRLGHPAGVADAGLWMSQDGASAVLAGGESDDHGSDQELAQTWRLTWPGGEPVVQVGPAMPRPHDDAAWAALPDGGAVVVGGVRTRRLLGRSLPTAVGYATRLRVGPVEAGEGE
ncbi:MAG: kelch repeat-containing protein [Planctomycetota bacterium]